MASWAPVRFALAFVACAAPSTGALAQVAGAAGVGASVPAQLGPFEIRVGATADRIGSSIAPRTTLDVQSTIALPVKDGGLWLGVSALQAKEIDSLPARPVFQMGAWRSFGDFTVRVGAASHIARLGGSGPRTWTVRTPSHIVADTLKGITDTTFTDNTYGDSGSPSRIRMWSDLEAGAAWTAGRYRLDAALGARPAIDKYPAAAWGRITGTMQLTSHLALAGGLGTQPAQIALGVPSSRVATLSLNVAPWRRADAPVVWRPPAAAFSVRPAGAGRCVVAYEIPHAHRVDVSGDFDDWEPIALSETRPGLWIASVAMPPGTYHMNVRVDGGRWTAPPGMTTVDDGFNGTVGIVVVP